LPWQRRWLKIKMISCGKSSTQLTKWKDAAEGTTIDVTKSMPQPHLDGVIDLISNTATLANINKNLEFPEMTEKKIKRRFSVSSLGEDEQLYLENLSFSEEGRITYKRVTGLLVFLMTFSYSVLAETVLEDIERWIELQPMLDPPSTGSVITYDGLGKLRPWIVPGLFEELSFPGVEVVIQETQSFLPYKSFALATVKHAGEARIGSDGSLENYSSGQPFSDERIKVASPDVAGFMIGWNHNHRWQHYGPDARGVNLIYLGAKQNDAPVDIGLGLLGQGSIDRLLNFDYRKVYLNNVSMLASQNYKVNIEAAETTFLKEFYEFTSPHNVAGTRFLVERKLDQHADDQVNIYSPTERRIRRYSARERADPVMGSNFTLDDVEAFSGRILDYKWRLLGERKVLAVSNSEHVTPKTFGPYSRVPYDRWQLRNCYALELESILPDHPYKKRFLFIDKQTYTVVAALVIDRSDQFWKVLYNVYKWEGPINSTRASVEVSMPKPYYATSIDLLANTATVVHTYSNLKFSKMSPKKIKRLYSVSTLGEGR
jgi:hypothetical protein